MIHGRATHALSAIVSALALIAVNAPAAGPLDPRGKIHIPVGVPNTLDTLKTFVEPEGNFSPGVGSYGVYFWLYDRGEKKLYAPTMEGVKVEHGLAPGGLLIPWSEWDAGGFRVRSEVAEVRRESKAGDVFVVAARVTVTNTSNEKDPRHFSLYAALRPLGPAGWPVHDISLDNDDGRAAMTMLVDGRCAIVPDTQASAAGVVPDDSAGKWADAGEVPQDRATRSPEGNCSGLLRFDRGIPGSSKHTFGFICPVLPGRRAVAHQWDGKSEWAQLDLAVPNPPEGGQLQPDPGPAFWRSLTADDVFRQAEAYWRNFTRASLRMPDRRWGEAFAAITAHAAVAMNEGAPDVTVVNYNVFNRDGVYTTSILQKVGRFDLAAECIDYFIAHPFNGRVYPEADNPGQVLWIMGEHWKFTRDMKWLERVYPAAMKLGRMIEYYRTTPGPHWVNAASLDFGDALPPDQRQKLEPGRCDGHHPEYTEAFDIAGLRAALSFAQVMDTRDPAAGISYALAHWPARITDLYRQYDARFGGDLRKQYGSYCVLWPCQLYPLDQGKAHDQFKAIGRQTPESWRYFPLATAHQGLLAGNRAAAHETIDVHLGHEQMAGGKAPGRGWYAFDEGGKSGPGGWHHLRTTWNKDVAMPHGWAVAELHLLIRDSLLYEDDDKLILLAGVPPAWFTHEDGIEVKNLATHFGNCSFTLERRGDETVVTASTERDVPGGLVIRAPKGVKIRASLNGKPLPHAGS